MGVTYEIRRRGPSSRPARSAIRSFLLLAAALGIAAVTGSAALSRQPGAGNVKARLSREGRAGASAQSKLTWDSSKVAGVDREWHALDDSYARPMTNEKYDERIDRLAALVRRRFSNAELRDLAETCGTLPVEPKDWGDFRCDLIDEMAFRFITSGDRESLVTLFSNRFPPRYYVQDIENLLVERGNGMREPVLVLGEAYLRCHVPEVRREIAGAVRRGFIGSGIVGKDDAEFVKNAMRWYCDNKERLIYNDNYGENASNVAADRSTNPLFVFKPGKKGEKSGTSSPGQ